MLAWATEDGVVRLRNLGQGSDLVLAAAGARVEGLDVAPDGTGVAIARSDGNFEMVDLAGKPLRHTRYPVPLRWVGFGPDAGRLALLGDDGLLRVRSLRSGATTALRLASPTTRAPTFAGPDRVVLAAVNGEVRVFELEVDDALSARNLGGPVGALALAGDGRLGFAAGDGRVLLLDVGSGRTRVMGPTLGAPQLVTLEPDSGQVVSTGAHGAMAWFALDGSEVAQRDGAGADIVAVAARSRTVALAGADQGIQVMMTRDNGFILRGHRSAIRALALSPDGKLLASAGDSTAVRLWQLGEQRGQLLTGHSAAVTALAFSPRGDLLASGGDDTSVRVWRIGGVTPTVEVLAGHGGAVEAVTFVGPGGDLLASASRDASVRLWQLPGLESRKLVHSSAVRCLSASPDGRWLATGSTDGSVRVWDTRSAELVQVVQRLHTAITGVQVAPDGSWVAAGDSDGLVLVHRHHAQAALNLEALAAETSARLDASANPITPVGVAP